MRRTLERILRCFLKFRDNKETELRYLERGGEGTVIEREKLVIHTKKVLKVVEKMKSKKYDRMDGVIKLFLKNGGKILVRGLRRLFKGYLKN